MGDDPLRSPFATYLGALLDEFRGERSGDVATYIPQLGEADPEWFSIAVCTTDGHIDAVGDADVEFTIQSISKPFLYGEAIQEQGMEAVLSRVGVEPSGNTFNAIVVDGTNRPFNPMVNAGAIVTTAMVPTEEHVLDVLSRFAGRPLRIDRSVYESERMTGDRNRAISYLMSSFGTMADHAETTIDRYFRQCSVSVTCPDLAVMAATLANRGRNPLTGEVALVEDATERVLSVMSSCGMYDASGEWMLRIGLPAKSGVSGGIIAVLPGQFGIAVFSPRLDEHFNSVRGIAVCERIGTDFDLHPMRFAPDVAGVVRRSYTAAEVRSTRLRSVDEVALLHQHGGSVRVLELHGELYLATAERVARQVLEALDDAGVVLLDGTRVTRMDASVRQLLHQLGRVVEERGGELVLAGLSGSPAIDVALEACEDRVLARHGHAGAGHTSLADQEMLAGLDGAELEAVAAAVRPIRLRPGETLFKQGDPADAVVFILDGSLSVRLEREEGETVSRIARLGPGLAVGELAMTGEPTRSATVVAEEDVELAELPLEALAGLAEEHPGLPLRLERNLARILALRLRTANDQLRQLSR